MNVVDQKRVAKTVLDKIKKLDYRAIIAGGAARDWYFNNLANDIDIFYYNEEDHWCNANIQKQKTILKALLGVNDLDVLGFNPNDETSDFQPKDDFTNYLKNPDIVNVFECEIEGLKFQFIQLKRQNVQVNKFAYNMCQAWSDGVNIWTTRNFDIGVEKQFLIETGELYANTEKFKEKMMSKFYNYEYIAR